MEKKKKINWNYIALGLLLAAYLASAVRFFVLQRTLGDGGENGQRIIRVAHWQLEPGYREALGKVIDDYNALPRVKEANVTVMQTPITERVYSQFMNVHLISGTAPDIAVTGKTQLIQGSGVARFFTALGEYVGKPNPYNAKEFTSPELDADLRDYLAKSPWKDTFMDGMEGGWNDDLSDYYSVPVSNFGKLRLFYNGTILKDGKAFLRHNISLSPQPEWLQDMWIREEGGQTFGYLPDNQRLRDWLANDQPPETLGQFLLYCNAIQEMAVEQDLKYLAAISGSNYFVSNLANLYQPAFFSHYSDELDIDGITQMSGLEAISGWDLGVWSFNSPEIREFYNFARTISDFFPMGYLGLDREQAQRRFVLGNAAIISSGGWDASGIFKGVASRDREEDRFEVILTPAPLPVEGERWAKYIPYRESEANFKAGVPMGINKQSPNFDWALDFLMYISSQPVNESFNQQANWLPAVVGGKPAEMMVDFMPITEGFPATYSFSPGGMRASVRSKWDGQSKLVMTGDITYEDFNEEMSSHFNTPRIGVKGYWFEELLSSIDRSRALDRTLAVEEFNQLVAPDEEAAQRERTLFYRSLTIDDGVHLRNMWRNVHPGEPYPNF
ncbi:hypothetical protein [Cerasicoccus arenae]|uniref:Uncharacterized protein n=1 Tax=Cerasicoccus arenae TaxID=424488 RepID=A0A8J3DC18_9BACT|nr:hypothetical protein [Cerasicoccus arenae]MBK1859870.1 hypothetical protein [Cerasicoccus arenae]GHC01358.1 hypothetical protein GCM10007047_17270 [Cerasicoccus arenae]